MIKLILGGFPCTQFSIAQKNKRIYKVDFTADEFINWKSSTPEWWLHIDKFEKLVGDSLGIENYKFDLGLQLFFNCIVAVDRTIADGDTVYYLFENVASMQKQIKEVMEEILFKLYGGQMTEINSALVSAQNRKRIYFTNFGEIKQPEDKGILLRDVLDRGLAFREKSYCLDANYYKATNGTKYSNKQSGQRMIVAEPVCVAQRGRYRGEGRTVEQNFEPREDGKTNTLTTVQKDNMVAEPIVLNDVDGKSGTIRATCYKDGIRNLVGNNIDRRTCVAESVKLLSEKETDYMFRSEGRVKYGYIQKSTNDKANCITSNISKGVPYNVLFEKTETIQQPIYEVYNGLIIIKGKKYPIKLSDGFYIIRKLTVNECRRLQTIPDWYIMPCSNTQNYKMLGNGWTVEIIKHILSHIPNIHNEQIQVLSMYDGMSCGMIALKEMEYNVAAYKAYEIDKYAIQTTQTNFPEIIQCGDAFQIRNKDWIYKVLKKSIT